MKQPAGESFSQQETRKPEGKSEKGLAALTGFQGLSSVLGPEVVMIPNTRVQA